MDENEMQSTLFLVAKLKAEFQLLKNAIMNSCELDYSEENLIIRDSSLIIEVMYLIEADEMSNCFDIKKSQADEEREKRLKMVAVTKEADNG